MILRKIFSYLTFKKQTFEGDKPNQNLRMMHGINRITIFMFLIGIIFVIIKFVFFKK